MSLVYQTIRSARRKTISLQVKHGQVVVRAPSFLSETEIDGFVRQKSTWLESKLKIQQHNIEALSCNFVNDGVIWVKGEPKTLKLSGAEQASIKEGASFFEVKLSFRVMHGDENCAQFQAQVKKQIALWFRQKSQAYLDRRLPELIAHTGLVPQSYKIRKYKGRWGSCNSRGELSFNTLLMMVPPWVFDYVIIHELCHLKYLNHSKDFWRLVAFYYPGYHEAKHWLKAHQYQLLWL